MEEETQKTSIVLPPSTTFLTLSTYVIDSPMQVRDVGSGTSKPGLTQKSVLEKTGFISHPGISIPRPRPITWKHTKSPSQSSSVSQSPTHSPHGSDLEQSTTFAVCAVVVATAQRAVITSASFMGDDLI